jgi:hypothetical protein
MCIPPVCSRHGCVCLLAAHAVRRLSASLLPFTSSATAFPCLASVCGGRGYHLRVRQLLSAEEAVPWLCCGSSPHSTVHDLITCCTSLQATCTATSAPTRCAIRPAMGALAVHCASVSGSLKVLLAWHLPAEQRSSCTPDAYALPPRRCTTTCPTSAAWCTSWCAQRALTTPVQVMLTLPCYHPQLLCSDRSAHTSELLFLLCSFLLPSCRAGLTGMQCRAGRRRGQQRGPLRPELLH